MPGSKHWAIASKREGHPERVLPPLFPAREEAVERLGLLAEGAGAELKGESFTASFLHGGISTHYRVVEVIR